MNRESESGNGSVEIECRNKDREVRNREAKSKKREGRENK